MAELLEVRIDWLGLVGQLIAIQVNAHAGLRVVKAGGDVIVAYQGAPWKAGLTLPVSLDGRLDPQALVLVIDPRPADLREAALLGVQVFCNPQGSISELLEAIGCAAARRAYAAPSLQSALMQGLRMTHPNAEQLEQTQRFGRLTPREREVALLVAQGKSDQQTATLLGIGPVTVNSHLKRVYLKLDVESRHELAWLLYPLDRRLPGDEVACAPPCASSAPAARRFFP